jgi:hypothetical protein
MVTREYVTPFAIQAAETANARQQSRESTLIALYSFLG